jgi:uncharacterized protein (DUF2236 family)
MTATARSDATPALAGGRTSAACDNEAMDASVERHQAAVRERLRRAGTARSGPGTISWAVNREVVVIAGWGRAILLQLAHPLVAAGVADHSSFRGDLSSGVSRLSSTVGAMLSLTFGSDDEAIAAAARINRIHDRVSGRLGDAGGGLDPDERYSAHDPELLRWVHATLVDSIPLTYEQLVGPLTAEERDRYCAEASIMEPLLDIPTGLLPRHTTELGAYMQATLGGRRIEVGARGRALARALLYPPGWRLLWPAFRPFQLLTIGLLPTAIREGYGFAWTPRDARALARWTAALRWVRRVTPRSLREWPAARRARGEATPQERPSDRAVWR